MTINFLKEWKNGKKEKKEKKKEEEWYDLMKRW